MTSILIYSVCIVIASYLGGALPGLLKLDHARMQVAISLVAGFMLGVAMWHMLLHSVPMLGSLAIAINWMMIGLLTMFFLIRAFHFHHHEVGEDCGPDDHDHVHGEPVGGARGNAAWLGTAVGMAVHTLIDGVALGASIAADDGGGVFAGVGTAIAIVLHKPLDALSIVALMVAGGASLAQQRTVNAVFALVCPLAAIGFYAFAQSAGGINETAVGASLAFSAGAFMCIALGDLLPELQFHSHDRMKLSAALVLGVMLAYGITYLEPEHLHGSDGSHDGHHSHEAGHSHDQSETAGAP